MNKRKDIIPNNLKEYRVRAGLTQKQVSRLLGFTNEVSLCHWEQGKNIPNLINLLRLCRHYEATPIDLYLELAKEINNEPLSFNLISK